LLDQTSIGFPPGMAAITQFGAKAQALLKDVPKDAKDEFDSRNKTRAKVEPDNIKGYFEVILLTDDESKKLVEGGGWEPLHKKYPKAPGITLVSRPGLNAERTRALLYIGTSCDMLCGEGVFFLLGKGEVRNNVLLWRYCRQAPPEGTQGRGHRDPADGRRTIPPV
jgi:hypothetical protein